IVSGTVWYSSYLADKIENDERKKVTLWVEAGKSINNPANTDVTLPSMIIIQKEIPIIVTTEKDTITDWINLDSSKVMKGWPETDSLHVLTNNTYLRDHLSPLNSQNKPVVWTDPLKPANKNFYYY